MQHVSASRRAFICSAGHGALALAAVGVVSALPGCGSGAATSSVTKSTGTVSLTLAWPTATTRFIPVAANSMQVEVTKAGTEVALKTLVVTRPQTAATLTGVDPGKLVVTVKAFASTDASGTALAVGATPSFVLVGGTTADVKTITMATTVTRITLSSPLTTVTPGGHCKITATALDADGNTVLVAPSAWTWAANNSAVATVVGSGKDNTATVTGVADGSTTIVAVDAEDSASAHSGSFAVGVAAMDASYQPLVGTWRGINSHGKVVKLTLKDDWSCTVNTGNGISVKGEWGVHGHNGSFSVFVHHDDQDNDVYDSATVTVKVNSNVYVMVYACWGDNVYTTLVRVD